MRVHQIIFGAVPGDAITTHMLEIDKRLRDWGLETSMYALHIAPEMADLVRPDEEYVTQLHEPDHLLIYHYGLYSPSIHLFQNTRGRRILVYHNITPSRFFRGWSREYELLCEAGRRTIPSLQYCDLALGVSEFNRQELIGAGFRPERTGVLPIFLTQADLDAPAVDSDLLAQLRESGLVNLLTVGRVAPHKAIEDVIRVFSVYHQTINPHSRLYIVGSSNLPAYEAALNDLIADLELETAVVFTGHVTDTQLKTYYRAADLYLHASHHEGFCVPLLESMYLGIPILARKAAAVPETLGDAGVLYSHLGYEQVAEMAQLLVTDPALRAHVIDRQRRRAEDFAPSRVAVRLRTLLSSLQTLPSAENSVDELR